MRFNVSHVRTHLDCPMKGYYQHVLLREPVGRSVALEIGSAWHVAMEDYLKNKDKDLAAATGDLVVSSLDVSPELYKKIDAGWQAIKPAFMAWDWPDEWELLGVEQLVEHRFKFPYELIIQGRLDGLVKWAGQYWHLQHKTLSPSVPLPVFAAYMQRDWHECWYEFACREAGYVPYGGTILNVVRKLSAKTIAADPKAAVSVQYIPRHESVVRKAMLDLEFLGQQIMSDRDFPEAIIQNRSMCAGHFRNSLCPYLDVCNGVAQITDDSRFVTVEDRYDKEETPLGAE